MVVSLSQAIYNWALGLTFALITIKFVFAYLLFKKYRENKENKLVLGASLLFVAFGFSRLLMCMFDYFLTEFDPTTFQEFSVYWKASNAILWAGFFIMIFIFETAAFKKKTHYIISIIFLVMTIISLAIPDFFLSQTMAAVPAGVALAFIPLSYIYLAKHAEIRKKALAIFAGFMIFVMGYFLLAEGLISAIIEASPESPLNVRYSVHIISICMRFGGIMLLYYGYII